MVSLNKEISIEDLTLSEEQEDIKNRIQLSNEHFFITGKAGTGKSTLLQALKKDNHKNLVVCAPTGVAALNVGGQTIHSLFGIPIKFVTPLNVKISNKTKKLLKKINMLIIDEISMLRADMLDLIDFILRQAKESALPFGGVQVIVFGDLYQLPPVINEQEVKDYLAENYQGIYFFFSQVWREAGFNYYELETIYRQKDSQFKDILNEIRKGDSPFQALNALNQRMLSKFDASQIDNPITLCSTNRIADEINFSKLAELEGQEYLYSADIDQEFDKGAYPTEEELKLKIGAQVILIRNDVQKRWVNGTVAKIFMLKANEVKIDIDGEIHTIRRETWEKIRYAYDEESETVQEKVVGSFRQFPLKLAWAITIHKSQGKSFDNVILDLGNRAFAHGQTYVALSRCRSLEGLFLKRPITKRDIIVDPAVNELKNFV